MPEFNPELPLLQTEPNASQRGIARLGTTARCLGIVLLLVLIRLQPQPDSGDTSFESAVTAQQLNEFLPDTADIGGPVQGIQQIQDGSGNLIAMVCQTQPAADKVIGYRGTTNLLLIMNDQLEVTQVELIASQDTEEHVDAVRRDRNFLDQFRGWQLGAPDSFSKVDATSGATLTALAAAQSVALRLGGEAPSLKFPNPLTPSDLELLVDLLPEKSVDGLSLKESNGWSFDVYDEDGRKVGRMIRTGPLSNQISGYQGPTELVAFCDVDDNVRGIRVRKTFENQPYAGYLNDEPWFWEPFEGRPFGELRSLDLAEEEVEGVSGATMTSMASAETVLAAALEFHRRQQALESPPVAEPDEVRWTPHDSGTVAILVIGIVVGSSRLRGSKWVRRIWFAILVGYFGLATGNLLSLAVVAAWSHGGIAWQMAPGMAAVIIVSLLMPPVTRRNIYCTHLCPHGAVQQLLRRLRLHWRSGRQVLRRIRWLPGLTLTMAVAATVLELPWNLAAWEPFDAWIWYIAGPASLILAAVSLIVSTMVPMAWCRYACGTGRLLDYVRHSAQAARFQLADTTLIALILLAASRHVL